jgi:hypothetical protein
MNMNALEAKGSSQMIPVQLIGGVDPDGELADQSSL